jgi:hypothetical protein
MEQWTTPRYWQLPNEPHRDGGSTKRIVNLSSAFLKAEISTAYPYGAMNSFPGWEFVSELPTDVQGGEES